MLQHQNLKKFVLQFAVAIELIVQHIRDFLNNRGRNIDPVIHPIICRDDLDETIGDGDEVSGSPTGTPKHGKKKNETHSHSMHRPH